MPEGDKGQGGNNGGPWGNGPWKKGPEKANNRPEGSKDDSLDDIIKKSQEHLRKIFSNGGGRGGNNGKGSKNFGGNLDQNGLIFILLIASFFMWMVSGIYTVNTKEEGIVLRFGKYVRTSEPGINYHWPSPIEKVIKLSVTERYRTEIGYNSESGVRKISRDANPDNRAILMLTGDENIVDVNFEVQWQISDARKFQFNVYDQQKTVRDAAESAMREVIGTTPLNDILSEGRSVVQLKTKELLQSTLDSYDMGVKIEEINMRGIPPQNSIHVENITVDENGEAKTEVITTTVDEAFKDVQAAITNKEETINTAIARSNEIIPQARGVAQKLIQDAQGYKEKVIARAEGDANRFLAVYNEYKKSQSVIKRRMYLETMEEILGGMDKTILDAKASNGVVPYLPLKELNKSTN